MTNKTKEIVSTIKYLLKIKSPSELGISHIRVAVDSEIYDEIHYELKVKFKEPQYLFHYFYSDQYYPETFVISCEKTDSYCVTICKEV